MSAFLCNPLHIGRLAAAIAAETDEFLTAGHIARVLAHENIRSVGYRYDETPEQVVGGPPQTFVDACVKLAVGPQPHINPERLAGMAGCLDYQSCEHPDYEQSAACHILSYAEDHFARQVCTALEIEAPLGEARSVLYDEGIAMGWEYSPQEEEA